MKSIVLFFCIVLCGFYKIQAQTDTTISLETVEVEAFRLDKFAVGSKTQTLDSLHLSLNNASYLSDILLQNTAVYIKEYGNGQLGTIAFRGTGAERTAVVWQGMNINSPSLGQSDFGTLPSFVLDNVQVQYGASSALYGSDAVGGTLVLGTNKNNFRKEINPFVLSLQQNVGSFGNIFSGIKADFSSHKLYINTKLYRFSLENNFPYTFRNEELRQENAGLQNRGLVQNIAYRVSNKSQLNFNFWHNENEREVQPVIGGNTQDKLSDQNTRLHFSYETEPNFGNLEIGAGYLRDAQQFEGSIQSEMLIERYFGKINFEKSWADRLSLQIGTNFYHIEANSRNYADNTSENRFSTFALFKLKLTNFWQVSLNARQTFVTGYNVPFTPSLGSELFILNKKKHLFSFKTLLAKSYRVPTLNERYWQPGGNPDILPEDSKNIDVGFRYSHKKENWTFESELTHFQIWVDNWILWTPSGGFWSPKNLRKVHSRGFELNSKLALQLSDFNFCIGGNYAYTQSTNEIKIDQNDKTEGNQLPYTPLHRWTSFVDFSYKTYFLNLNFQYIGLRYENLDNREDLLNSIPAFSMMNFTLAKNFRLKKHLVHLSLRVNNLFNETYQNYINRAMPPRNYLLSIRYKFTSSNPQRRVFE